MRCRDIPELPGLGAIGLRGGVSGADNPVRWPYVAENRSFSPWIKGGELVFVTGISRHRSPRNLAECLYEGKDCGISGLVVLTGDAYIGQLPTMLSRLADDLAMPLFEQPYSLPMVEVTETIGRAIVSSEREAVPDSAGTLAKAVADCIGYDRLQALVSEYLPEDSGRLVVSSEILEAWLAHRGNQSAMAQALGCHRNTIRNRMNRLSAELSDTNDAAGDFRSRLLAHLLTQP
ncbi:PucR family transcriptional regulator [Marinobacter zhanjiangensis]|nr:PucR family transcriptional regulator [Marinobacter zhanjiangensis]